MNELAPIFIRAILVGLGATLILDLWSLVLNHAFKIVPSNICFLGRWLLHMPEGTFRHSNISLARKKEAECPIGWIAHYVIGVVFGLTFVALAGNGWLQRPTPIPAVVFGLVTVSMPFFIMQPAFGLGFAASKTSNPAQARLRSLMNHAVFGVGLYLFGLLAGWLLSLNR